VTPTSPRPCMTFIRSSRPELAFTMSLFRARRCGRRRAGASQQGLIIGLRHMRSLA
jgi:hypothetical protein